MSDPPAGRLSRLLKALLSWRTASVALLSFSSGLPLGLVWIAIPDWMRSIGVDLRIVGLFTLAQAPWTFKILWSPVMDRYAPRWLGRRRGWIAITQVALCVLTLGLAGVGDHPDAPWIVLTLALAIAFASASQDIVFNAWTVEVLRPEEKDLVAGLGIGVYRMAMLVAGGTAITLAGMWSWPAVCIFLGLLYLPMLLITVLAPQPEEALPSPKRLRDAVWLPFLEIFSRPRAMEILGFVVLYKLADNLSQSLLRPFLVDMGYDEFHRGIALATVGWWMTFVGTMAGGALTAILGLGRALWIFGFLQIFSNLGYLLLTHSEVNLPLMYGALGFETLTTGLGMGAFAALLLRLTEKRFSATQYALFSSLFALPRIVSGPVTGYMVEAVGWTPFFVFTMVAGIPGLVLLARFVPWRMRDPVFTPEEEREAMPAPPPRGAVLRRALTGFLVVVVLTALTAAALKALDDPETGFDLGAGIAALLHPEQVVDWIEWAGIVAFGLVGAFFTAAAALSRRRSP